MRARLCIGTVFVGVLRVGGETRWLIAPPPPPALPHTIGLAAGRPTIAKEPIAQAIEAEAIAAREGTERVAGASPLPTARFFDSEKQKTDPPLILKFSGSETRISVGYVKIDNRYRYLDKGCRTPTPLL